MKIKSTILSLIFLFLDITICFPQTLTLTFTAEHDGIHTPLDSILIENLTQGGDTTLYSPDTSLVLDYLTGTDEIYNAQDQGFSLSQNYPNPFKDLTNFGINIREASEIIITVRDILGRVLVYQEYVLVNGKHLFAFYPGNERQYLLTAIGKNGNATIRMLNLTDNSAKSRNVMIAHHIVGSRNQLPTLKIKEYSDNFTFNLGDELKYTGFTALGANFITDTPITNQTYTFQYTGNFCPGIPVVNDIDGNHYNTILIGSQCWMVENLKTTTYNNGTPIPNVTNNGQWSNLTSGAYIWYENNTSNKDTYGALYNWYAVMEPNGLCPEGWHAPTNDDWTTLTEHIGGITSPYGNELKSCRQVNSPLGFGCNTTNHPRWAEHSSQFGTDDHGFSALPGGTRNFFGTFVTLGYIGAYWSSTESSTTYGWLRGFEYNKGTVEVFGFYKQNGYSVRCMKD